MAERLSRDDYYLAIARTVAIRADCTRRSVGAVVVYDDRIISAGYNGAPAGEPGCLTDGACPRGKHYWRGSLLGQEVCNCGNDWPCHLAVEPGSSYDTELGSCIAVHAEVNAILSGGGLMGCKGATMYCTEQPCNGCQRIIKAAGITRVVFGK